VTAGTPGLGSRFLATGPRGQLIDSVPGMPGWLRADLARARAAGMRRLHIRNLPSRRPEILISSGFATMGRISCPIGRTASGKQCEKGSRVG
jgi:hypothetical protein